MKNLFIAASSMLALSLLSSGCGQSTNEQAELGLANLTTVAQQGEGCCGKCSGESRNAKSTPASGCCGKCSESPDQTKSEAAEAEASKAVVSCENGCNACAEGKSESCKCGEEKPSEHVNSKREDRDIFHFLLEHHDKITRSVTSLENGVETITESTDPAVAVKIQEHVASMYQRVEDGRPLRMWDELYREIFAHADKIEMKIANTENGISVTETSEDPYVARLIQAHAKVVTGFSERGFDEARQNHTPPRK